MENFHVLNLINAAVYSLLGIVILVVAFVVVDKLTPFDLWKEVVVEKNLALATLVGLMSLGIAIIIAAAVH